jgi:hypothetical protein
VAMVGCLHAQAPLKAIIYVPNRYTRHAFPELINDRILINDFIGSNLKSWIHTDTGSVGFDRNNMFLLYF